MSTTSAPGALDFEIHQAHLDMCNQIDELRAVRDYEGLERVRRELVWLLDELRMIYYRAHTAVACTMPDEGFVLEGTRTYLVKIGNRRYVEHDRNPVEYGEAV